MKVLAIIFWSAVGYVIGSIPWGLVIGKVFFKKDIREYGSGNLGGTNAWRTLGMIPGIAVIVLDALKSLMTMVIVNLFSKDAVIFAGLAACVGHCYPCFAEFKGGKAVATAFGYFLGIGIFVTKDVIFSFIYPLLVFIIVLSLFKMVSLASMSGALCETIIAFLTYNSKLHAVCVLLVTGLIIYRHIPNILRIIKGKESKVSFIV